jgi:hypothetical protein
MKPATAWAVSPDPFGFGGKPSISGRTVSSVRFVV